jgi:hypothetical protein
MLLKPTIVLMLIASLVSSTLLVFVPWGYLFGSANPLHMIRPPDLGEIKLSQV